MTVFGDEESVGLHEIMPPKKVPFNAFVCKAKARNLDPPDEVIPEDVKLGEFRDTTLIFAPAVGKVESNITIKFRCTTRIVRGDNITIRLPGFKGGPMVFQLENKPHPEGKTFADCFQAYWSGEEQPKGAAAPQVIILQCQKAIDENTLVVLGVPETVQIQLPEKLGANSSKLKIEGVIKHAEGGKIAKAAFMESSEIKKRPVEEEIAELENLVKDIRSMSSSINEEDVEIASSVSREEADQIWEAARETCDLHIGMQWKIEVAAYRHYDEIAVLAKTITENSYAVSKKRISLALHREIAANLGVKIGAVIVLEDALYTFHASFYPELTRAAVLALRLYTMESNDILRVFGQLSAPCIHREISSAIRSLNTDGLTKWASFISVLMTTTSKLTNVDPEAIPVLYRGVKELPPDQLQHILSLKKDQPYFFPGYTTLTPIARYTEEGYVCPDNGVIFEVQGVVEALEIGDLSQYPEDVEWLLPLCSSFTVVSVEVQPERNHLTRVVLQMAGSLAGPLRDAQFPEADRSLASVVVKKVRSDVDAMSTRSSIIAKLIHAGLKLNERKALHPQFLLHHQYLTYFADTKRSSVAKGVIEDVTVRWQQCTADAAMGGDGVMRPATWENINKKQATLLEQYFLRRTRALKQFQQDVGFSVNFADFTADTGKGVKRIRRMIGKFVSHQAPLAPPPPPA